MARKPYTGGLLNVLNGKAGISAPQNSVSVSGLVKAHHPKSADELERLIADHVGGGCFCGIVSKGTVQDFGRNLYEAQKRYWNEYRFSLQDCIQWEYDLFILQMLKGTLMEDKCRSELKKRLGTNFFIENTTLYVDEELRIDLEIRRNKERIAGIQVKPVSYRNVRQNVQLFNEKANEKYDKPVLYAFYDYDAEAFVNIDQLIDEIRKLSNV